MFTKTHQGIVSETVVLKFENGYTITLEKGVEMSMHLVMDEKQIETRQQAADKCPTCKQERSWRGLCQNPECDEY